MDEFQVVQIMPAEGWLGVFKDDSGKLFANRLACWALIKYQDGSTGVVGMCGTDVVDVCDTSSNFDGYIHERGFGDVPSCYPTS